MIAMKYEVAVSSEIHEERYWQAVQTRDVRFDEQFVYAVRSTGIYCRPLCPSRKPRRTQAVFFMCADEAEQAGFTPCKRCQPNVPLVQAQTALAQAVCDYIDTHLEDTLTLKVLSAHVHVSPYHLQRTFKRMMGISPREYAAARRMETLKAQLRAGQDVTTALYDAGYGSSSRLYTCAADQIGMTPAMYQKRGQGMRIGYTIVDSPLGRLLVAATERGVCAVSLGNTDDKLAAALAEEYRQADIQRNDDGFQGWVQAILAYLNGQQPDLNLPLDVQATAFQWRVWQALQKIPYGSTTTYSELARSLGQPTATRAVARACATNPVSLVVPCHRVVGTDGSLRGYRWGVERKHQLLEQERARANGETKQD